jgi:hypothetical protein
MYRWSRVEYISRVRDLTALMHLGLKLPALCAPHPINGALKLY